MIPLQCVDDRSDGDAPPGFGPRNTCPEPVTAPAPSRGQPPGTLQRRATRHQRERSPKLCGHYGPIWSCGNRGGWHWA